MVARYLGVVEAAGSNLVTQTRLGLERNALRVFYFILCECPALVMSAILTSKHRLDLEQNVLRVLILFLA